MPLTTVDLAWTRTFLASLILLKLIMTINTIATICKMVAKPMRYAEIPLPILTFSLLRMSPMMMEREGKITIAAIMFRRTKIK